MTVISSPLYRWRVGEVEITRVLEFEAALFEPAVLLSRGVLSQQTLPWREMDSNFRFRASGDTPHPARGICENSPFSVK
jgi:hypothetical protein